MTIPSSDPALVWEYRPNTEYRNLRTNQYGFRDREYESPAKPRDVHRIGFIGDSVTLGLGVDDDQIFVTRFESLVNEPGTLPSVQALNFGIDGYNAAQIFELLRTRVLAFQPDEIVYVMCLNDFNLGASTGEKMAYFRKPFSFFLLKAGDLYTQLKTVGKVHLTPTEDHEWWFGTGKHEVFAILLKMRDLLQQRGIAFHVAVVPMFRFDGQTFASYPLTYIHESIARFCAANSIRFTDLLSVFMHPPQQPDRVAQDIWHPNSAGHRLIAKELARTIPGT